MHEIARIDIPYFASGQSQTLMLPKTWTTFGWLNADFGEEKGTRSMTAKIKHERNATTILPDVTSVYATLHITTPEQTILQGNCIFTNGPDENRNYMVAVKVANDLQTGTQGSVILQTYDPAINDFLPIAIYDLKDEPAETSELEISFSKHVNVDPSALSCEQIAKFYMRFIDASYLDFWQAILLAQDPKYAHHFNFPPSLIIS